jgi:hypothetical protein
MSARVRDVMTTRVVAVHDQLTYPVTEFTPISGPLL